MKERRVVVTGAGGVTAFGNSWDEIKPRLQLCRNAVRRMTDWDVYKGLNARIAAPVEDFTLPDTYTRKKTRSLQAVWVLLSAPAAEVWTVSWSLAACCCSMTRIS